MLVLKNIEKKFISGDVETLALSKVDITVDEGAFTVITGPSGSGKTTLLNIAGLLEVSNSGYHSINGQDVSDLSDSQRAKIRRELVGFIFQGFNLLPDLSVKDNIELPMRLRGMGKKERQQKVEESLKLVGLTTRQSHYPAQLSGGQQQRVAIARAIAGSPKLIFADEPTGNLDSTMSADIMKLLQEINGKGTTIVMVTHDDVLAKLASHRIEVRDGQILKDYKQSQNQDLLSGSEES